MAIFPNGLPCSPETKEKDKEANYSRNSYGTDNQNGVEHGLSLVTLRPSNSIEAEPELREKLSAWIGQFNSSTAGTPANQLSMIGLCACL